MSGVIDPLATTAWTAIQVIGIGDDGVESLGRQARSLVDTAELLCGGERQLDFFPRHPAERFVIKSNIAELTALLTAEVGRRRVVVLASGDPCFFGIGPILVAALGIAQVQIHSQVSSVALAFARLGMSWQDAVTLSAHGRPLQNMIVPAMRAAKFAVLTDAQNTPAAVALALRNAGMDDAPAWVCEHLGGPEERITPTTLHALADQRFADLNVLVVRRSNAESGPGAAPAFGQHETMFASERGQITKAEVRAVTLSKLEPWRAHTAWDVGAGSGSLSLELAGLMPDGIVYAVEKDPGQIAVLRRNAERYPRANVQVIAGEAPLVLATLPAPDTVFIGGSGGGSDRALPVILDAVMHAILPGGRVIANFTQLESLATWQAYVRGLGWPAQVLQVAISRGAPIQDGTRLAPLNPVFITAVQRPDGEPT